MSKVLLFDVELPNNGQVFFAGQVVNGRVVLKLSGDMKINAVRFHISGKAHIHWVQSKDTAHRDLDGSNHFVNHTHVYKDSETYIETEVVLWGNQIGVKADASTLAAGSYQFPFTFTLPPNCNSSFESQHGYIRYFCQATLDRSWKTDYVVKRPFSVAALVDLNLLWDLEQPKSLKRMKSLRGFMGLTKQGSIHWELKMPRTGFVPGELIPFEVLIDNQSSIGISEVSMALEQKVMLIAENRHTKIDKRQLLSTRRNNIEAKQTLVWKNDSLRVPPVAPNLSTCRVMRIFYQLSVTITPKGMHLSDTAKMRLFIGNIPLRSTMAQLNYQRSNSIPKSNNAAASNTAVVPSAPADAAAEFPSAPTLPLPSDLYPDLPLPTYEEVMGQQTQMQDEDGRASGTQQAAFAPRYMYYDWTRESP